MQFGDVALGQRHDADAGEGEPLVERRHILLVARQPVERLGHDHVELAVASVAEQALIAGAQSRCAADRPIIVGVEIGPALPFDEPPNQPNLVLDRGLALVLRGIPGVDYRTHQ